ncbi:MAG: AraC family transcriptional regulator [Clostridiales bacterium]|nr:helix-turn-helix transcriptional regulator [Clostridiales bacterium]MDU3241720.1 AraC family transcriptional regulator [Clostridiales bacterium]
MPNHEYEYIKHSKTSYCKIFLAEIYQSTPQHWHSDIELLLVLEGTLAINSLPDTPIARAQDIILFNSYETHRLTCTSGKGLVLAVQFSSSFCRSYYPSLEYTYFTQNLLCSGKYSALQNLMVEMASSFFREPQYFSLHCIGLLNLLAEQLLIHLPYSLLDQQERSSREKNIFKMQKILNHIEKHYTEKLLLSDISKLENLSLHYLSHLFKKTLGISFQSYMKQLRFEKALNLLTETDSSILDICIASGFSDIKYLNQLFDEYFGCTPGQYRRRLREKQNTPAPIPYIRECFLTDKVMSENFSILCSYYPDLEPEMLEHNGTIQHDRQVPL